MNVVCTQPRELGRAESHMCLCRRLISDVYRTPVDAARRSHVGLLHHVQPNVFFYLVTTLSKAKEFLAISTETAYWILASDKLSPGVSRPC